MPSCRRPQLLGLLALFLALAPITHAADAPAFPEAKQFEYSLPADYPRRWWVPESLLCTYLVQEPQRQPLPPDAPIFVYMHMAGGHQEQGMGLSAAPADPERICWDCLRDLLNRRGWIYVCPEFHEFDYLLKDLRRRYGERPVYVAGAALGGRAVLEDIRAHAADEPGRYAGLVLLSPAVDLRFYPDDEGFGDIAHGTFPMRVYLLAGTQDGPVASATARLFCILRDEGTPVKLVLVNGRRQGGAVVGANWNDVLDFLDPSRPPAHPWEALYPSTQNAPDPAHPRAYPAFPVAPEPSLVTYAPGFSYWVVEPFLPDRMTPESGLVVFIDADEPNRLRGLGYYGGEYDSADKDGAATACWQQLAVTLSNRGWLYVLPRRHRIEGLADDLAARYGARLTYLIGVAEGGRAALDEALARPGRYAGIMLMQPVLDAAAIDAATHAPQLPPLYITARASDGDAATQQCRNLANALKSAGKSVKLVELAQPPGSRPVIGTDWSDVLAYLAAPRPPAP